MSDWLLRARHWQLFGLAVALPYVLGSAVMISAIRDFAEAMPSANDYGPASPFAMLTGGIGTIYPALGLALALGLGVYLTWGYAVVDRLGALLPEPDRVEGSKYFVPVAAGLALATGGYLLFHYRMMSAGFGDIAAGVGEPGTQFLPSFFVGFALAAAMGLLAFGLQVFLAVVTAKVILRVGQPERSDGGSLALAVFAVLYFPFGVWWLQPKVNRVRERARLLAAAPPLPGGRPPTAPLPPPPLPPH